jgi:hypothetical protein
MNKYEKLIEFIINEQEDKARELFHDIVLEKSRSIYESLMDEEVTDEAEISTDEVGDLANDVSADEEGVNEEEDEDDESEKEFAFMGDEGDEDDEEDDMAMDTGDEDDEEPATKGDIMDIESAIDELKAEFDKIMGMVDADADGDHDMQDHDMADLSDEVEELPAEEGIQFEEEVAEEDTVSESDEEMDDEEDTDTGDEELAKLREYVEKVAGVKNIDGADNKSSVVAGKNDMGGTTANIVKGGDEAGGKAPTAKLIATGNKNVPGGNQGLESAPKAKSAE